MNIKIVNGISQKSGNPYEALEVRIGEYTARLFPTKIEMLYIKQQLKDQAHDEFQGE